MAYYLFIFRRFWVKELRHSGTISDEKRCYLYYRSTRRSFPFFFATISVKINTEYLIGIIHRVAPFFSPSPNIVLGVHPKLFRELDRFFSFS